MKINCPNYKDWPNTPGAAEMSKLLKTRALFVANSDTGGVAQYVMFDNGKIVELFDSGSVQDEDATAAAAVRQFSRGYGLDLSGFDDVQVALFRTFASSLRKVNVAKIKNDLDFIDEFVKQQDAFVPFFIEEWGKPGDSVELAIEGLGPDDIERLDYVAVSATKG